MSESETRPEAPPSRVIRIGNGVWLFLTVLVLVVGWLIAYLKPFQTGEKTLQVAKEAAVDVAKVAAEATVALVDKLRPEVTTENFSQWRDLSVMPSKGNLLEVATAEASETFSRTTNVKLFDRVVPGSTSVYEITVPATYRYHIDLDDPWEITTEGSRVIVRAPRVRPTLPVAFDTAGVKKMTSAGWARWDLDAGLSELDQGVTELLATRAADPATIAKIEDEGRLAVARFVRNWLLARNAWGEDRFEEIMVIFEGEDKTTEVLPPMLRIEPEREVLP